MDTSNIPNNTTIKIIVRYCLPWGNFSTQIIEIDPNGNAQQLFIKIEEKLGIPQKNQIIKYKKDNLTIRIIPECTIKSYDISDRSILFVENLESQGDKEGDNNIIMNGYKMHGRYYAKLGILSTINDEEEQDDEDKSNKVSPKRKDSPGCIPNKCIEEISEMDLEKIPKKLTKFDDKSKEEVEKFLKDSKEGNIKKIKETLSRFTIEGAGTGGGTNSPELNLVKIKKLIDEKGNGGWNSLHFAIFFGHQIVVKEFIEKNADINIETSDGWTPLQLALHKSQAEIVKMLLKCNNINVNQRTIKGTALHIAAKTGRLESIQLILTSGADTSLQDDEGKTPYEVASSEELKAILEKATPIQQETSVLKVEDNASTTESLPIVKGWMYKKSGLLKLSLKKRYFVMNPYEGTLIRYKKAENYPNKPIEVIPLKDITGIRRITQGWLDKKAYYYLEFYYTGRFTFATETESAIIKWENYLQAAVKFALYIENKLKETVDKLGIQNVNSGESEIPKTLEVIEISDTISSSNTPTINTIGNQIKSNNDPDSTSNSTPILKGSGSPKANSPTTQNMNQSPLSNNSTTTTATSGGSGAEDVNKQDAQNKVDLDELKKITDEKVNLLSFEVLKVLGSGAFGKVYKVKKKDSGKIYAMKALKKRHLIMKNQLRYAVTECNVLKNANHPFLLGLHFAFQTPTSLYLVLDYCPGGDLSLHLAQCATFEEDQARFYLSELILAIEQLHSMNVIYRDLKPENILIAEDGHIKLADFGLAKEGIINDATTNSFCGSPAYLSPEMLNNKSVGKAADIYGIGTVLYEMLVGQSPYYDDDIPKLYGNIKKGKLIFPKYVSETAKSFMIKLLNRDPNERIGVKDKNELKNDPFFKGLDWNAVLRKEYQPPILDYIDDEDEENTSGPKINLQDSDYNERNARINRVKNFTFVGPKNQVLIEEF